MGLWTKIKNMLGFGVEATGGKLPEVTRHFPMPPVKPPREPDNKKKEVSGRKLSSEMPKAVKPRIKRRKGPTVRTGLSAGTLLAAAHDDLEDIVGGSND